jgi:hypothetical protein
MADKWTVTSQNLTTAISDTGTGFDSVWEVGYQVTTGPATGTKGVVKIPAAQYNAETVAAAINAAVFHLDKIAAL